MAAGSASDNLISGRNFWNNARRQLLILLEPIIELFKISKIAGNGAHGDHFVIKKFMGGHGLERKICNV